MNRLLEIGFELAGHWILENDKLKCELSRHSRQKNILYAFVCDGQVKYVGKTVQVLAVRMAGYKTPGRTQTTNRNNHRWIKQLLSEDVAVDIFALPDSGLLHYGQFHLNLAAALEDDIIRVIEPEWNGGVSESAVNVPASSPVEPETQQEPELESVTSVVGTFSFVLQPTYYRTGFFNVGVSSQKFLGADGETIELFLGNSTQPILGTINRRANMNGTPRIMGGTGVRDWFKENASVDANISVEVLSPTAIRLRSTEEMQIEVLFDSSAEEAESLMSADTALSKRNIPLSKFNKNNPVRGDSVAVRTAEYNGTTITQLETGTIEVKVGENAVKAMPELQRIAQELKIGILNGAGNPYNTRQLGTVVLKALAARQ